VEAAWAGGGGDDDEEDEDDEDDDEPPAVAVSPGTLVEHAQALWTVAILARGPAPVRVAAAAQLATALLTANPLNVVALELSGVLPALSTALTDAALGPPAAGAAAGPLGVPGSPGWSPPHRAGPGGERGVWCGPLDPVPTVVDLLGALQLAAVVTADRDRERGRASPLLLHLTRLAVALALAPDVPPAPQPAPPHHQQLLSPPMCHNCECVTAALECLSPVCRTHAALLCGECDRVFHKPSAKQNHVRLPVRAYGRRNTGSGKGMGRGERSPPGSPTQRTAAGASGPYKGAPAVVAGGSIAATWCPTLHPKGDDGPAPAADADDDVDDDEPGSPVGSPPPAAGADDG
jgi:hypothetical protein